MCVSSGYVAICMSVCKYCFHMLSTAATKQIIISAQNHLLNSKIAVQTKEVKDSVDNFVH